MNKTCRAFLAGLMVLALVASPAAAQEDDGTDGRDPEFEQEIYDRLGEIDPDAVSLFREATEAMDAGDLGAAKAGYERVLELAPDFPDALRRLSFVELQSGNVETAIELARQASAVGDSPYNEIALARALLATEDPDDAQEAMTLAVEADRALPDDPSINTVLLLAAIANENIFMIRKSLRTLLEVAPDQYHVHYFAGLVAMWDGELEKAEQEFDLAEDLGMPAEMLQDVRDQLEQFRVEAQQSAPQAALPEAPPEQAPAPSSSLESAALWAGGALGAWLLVLAILYLAGTLLSSLTLRAVSQVWDERVGAGERTIRRVYRVVIAFASLFFYASIPLVLLLVVAVTVGLFYLFVSLGRIPVQFGVMLLIMLVYSLYAIVRSLFARIKDEEPGRPLAREEAPRLWQLVEEVAEQVGTRPVDAIYVTPGTGIAVTERGRLLQKLQGYGQRCLILGLGVLPGMTQGQFRAIMAHEYGHFSNRDTAGGNLARQVQASIYRMAYTLATKGQARWYNPAWLFVSGFQRIYLRITLGASRLQEILADRYAALTYGLNNFGDGLTHVVRQGLTFDAHVAQTVNLACESGADLPNLYGAPALADDVMEKVESRLEQVMSRPTSPYDSHPAIRERFALLERLDVVGGLGAGASREPVWDLLPNAGLLQEEMTDRVEENVRKRMRR